MVTTTVYIVDLLRVAGIIVESLSRHCVCFERFHDPTVAFLGSPHQSCIASVSLCVYVGSFLQEQFDSRTLLCERKVADILGNTRGKDNTPYQ